MSNSADNKPRDRNIRDIVADVQAIVDALPNSPEKKQAQDDLYLLTVEADFSIEKDRLLGDAIEYARRFIEEPYPKSWKLMEKAMQAFDSHLLGRKVKVHRRRKRT